MKRKSIIVMLIVSLILALGVGTMSYADDLQDQMDQVTEQKNEVSAEMSELTQKVQVAQAEVDEIQGNIDQKQTQIDKTIVEIKQTMADIDARQKGLDDRLRTMYKNGSIGYLDVLLGSNSISEFLTNVEMIQRIYRNDQNTLVELEEQHKMLEEKQVTLETERSELAKEKEKAAKKQSELQVSQAALQEKLDALNAEADAISAEIAERQRQAEEKRKQEEASKTEDEKDDDNGGESSGTGTGQFIWPCDSRYITSYFGYRIHPLTGIYTGHTGLDIGCSMYDPIYAADSGTVILSQWYGGYGYAVVIDHGDGISTLYGHNEELHVSVGEKVSKGQTIASAGSTGWSTGPHLHFEVRINGEYVDPMNYF